MEGTNEIKKQIREAIPSLFKNIRELADVARVNQPNLSAFMNDKRKSMKLETAWKIWAAMQQRKELKEKQNELTTVIKETSAFSKTEIVAGNDLETVFVYQKAAAGNAIALSDIDPLCEIKLPFKYITKFDFAVLVDGHSMEPTIKHESIIGAKEDFEFVTNELYVAQIPYEGLVVKRVAINRDNQSIVFKSDNPNKEHYPDIELCMSESERFIHGRVVWIMYRY
ncbi:MAG: S24 family peptidase [Desulfovibrio sp.]|jgi:phage repressor protein C with HTH and peptisase S24 domain|nr:S24 family peptidase [Desulfovibrio sp.]